MLGRIPSRPAPKLRNAPFSAAICTPSPSLLQPHRQGIEPRIRDSAGGVLIAGMIQIQIDGPRAERLEPSIRVRSALAEPNIELLGEQGSGSLRNSPDPGLA